MIYRISSAFGVALVYLAGTATLVAQSRDSSQNFEKCKAIANDQERLRCLKSLLQLPSSSSEATTGQDDPWLLVRTPNPKGGKDAVAIMRTADTAQSDPDLAGLMVRCADGPGLELLLALVRPLPPRAKRDVLVAAGTSASMLRAEASPSGTALILPMEASALLKGPWQEMKGLAITIKDPEAEIHGLIPLDGVARAIAKLSANCPSG
jgi:hypothetical protein